MTTEKPPLKIYEGGRWQFAYAVPESTVSLSEIVNGTIEDCAQLVDSYEDDIPGASTIAAAIRAQKKEFSDDDT